MFWPRLGDPFVCQNFIRVYVSFSGTDVGLCIYHLFLHIFQWIALPTQSCLVLYSFYANLLHSLIIWYMLSPLSPHNLLFIFIIIIITPCWDRYIQSLASSCFFYGRLVLWATWPTSRQTPKQGNFATLLTALLDWPLSPRGWKHPLYIFWTPAHIFQPTQFTWHFRFLLFTLRRNCLSCFWNPY